MVECPTDEPEMFTNGELLDAFMCFFTNGGDSTMEVAMPTMVWGAVMLSLFIKSESAILPSVVGMIFAGLMLAVLPASGTTIAVLTLLVLISLGATLLSLRLKG